MVSFTFVVCAEPYKYEAIDTVINLGEVVIKKGHEIIGVFLYGSGVYNIKSKKITGDTMRNLPERLNNFCREKKTELKACSTWISFTGIQTSEFVEGGIQEGLGALSDMISRSDKVIFFGPGG
ncbi:MAG: DsrE/DsrF/TusD sulfur relay family protein [Candidatus Hodarchaeales archaeon]|jgi:sulfur relay (sulfurtransferase) complex TusBCD TusD component (DsrE family)